MKLYDYPHAPNPRRVRVFLAEKGITIPRVNVDIMKGEHRTAQFAALNPRQAVPVLELDDGTVIAESIAICRYFEETHRRCSGPRRWSAPKSRCGSGASSSA